MVEQPTAPATPPPTNGTAPAAPPQMVTVKIDGRTTQEPLSKVVEAYQMAGAAEQRLKAANDLASARAEQIKFAEYVQSHSRANPEAAAERILSEMERMAGRKINLPARHAPASADAGAFPGETGGSAESERIRALESRIQELDTGLRSDRQTRAVETAASEIRTALDQYPVFRGDAASDLRGVAEFALAGMRASNPEIPISDLATKFHAGIQQVLQAQTTTQHQQLTAQAATLAGIPSSTGTPAMTERPATPTVADVKSGKARGMLQDMLGRLSTQMSQNVR